MSAQIKYLSVFTYSNFQVQPNVTQRTMKRARDNLYQLLDLEAGEGDSDEEDDDNDDGTSARIYFYRSLRQFLEGFIQDSDELTVDIQYTPQTHVPDMMDERLNREERPGATIGLSRGRGFRTLHVSSGYFRPQLPVTCTSRFRRRLRHIFILHDIVCRIIQL